MSTRVSLASGPSWHLWQDWADPDGIYLERYGRKGAVLRFTMDEWRKIIAAVTVDLHFFEPQEPTSEQETKAG